MLPPNIQDAPVDDLPAGVFLYPLCTSSENFALMLAALDSVYKNDKENVGVIKDFLNAQQFVGNPYDSECVMAALDITAEVSVDGHSFRWLRNGSPISDWIFPPAGPAGEQGLPGEPGATGAQGIQGIPGEPGATGAQGIQGIPGEPGATGAQGIQGVPGEVGINDVDAFGLAYGLQPTATLLLPERTLSLGIPAGAPGESGASAAPDLDTPDESNICAAVMGMRAWAWDKWDFAREQTKLAHDETVAKAEAATAIIEAITGIGELLPIDEVIGWMDTIWELDFAQAALDTSDPDYIEAAEGDLYCALLDLPSPQLTEDAFIDWLAVSVAGNANEDALAAFLLTVLGYNEMKRRFWVYGQDSSSVCAGLFDCTPPEPGNWEQEFIFNSSDQQGWVKFGGRACTFGSGGIAAGEYTEANNTRRQVTLYHNLPYADGTTTITGFEQAWDNLNIGNSNTNPATVFNMRLRSGTDGTGSILADSGSSNSQSASGTQTAAVNHAATTGMSLIFYAQFAQRNSSTAVTGSGNVTRYKITGTGKNPFVP